MRKNPVEWLSGHLPDDVYISNPVARSRAKDAGIAALTQLRCIWGVHCVALMQKRNGGKPSRAEGEPA